MATSNSPQSGIYTDQHAGRNATMHFDAGSKLDVQALQLGQGLIDISPYIFTAREVASGESITSGTTAPAYFFGGLLLPDTSPALLLSASDAQTFYLNYASAVVDGIKLPPVAMPNDLSTAQGLTVSLYGEVIGTATAADAAQGFDIRCWGGIGATTEFGSTHPNFTSTPSYKSISITSANTPTDVLNITLIPQAHAGRAIRLYGGKIAYTRVTS